MIRLDGSFGEGGGQIIRTALALSTITNKPFEAFNIRNGRKQPGLKAQHLHCLKALQQLCDAKFGDAHLGSEKLTYIPGKIKGRNINIDIGTAGSVSLLLQSILLPTLFSDKKTKISITGGTSGKWAMPFDFFKFVFLPHIYLFADSIEANLLKRGYYPRGGGLVELKVVPKEEKVFPSINSVQQHNLIHIRGVSHASADLQKVEVADRQAKYAKFQLSKLNVPVRIQTVYSDTLSTGSGITLWAVFSQDQNEVDVGYPIILGSDVLGEKGKKAELVGKDAADNLLKEIASNAPVDEFTADSLIPFMALNPPSEIRVSKVSEHTKTNIWVVEQFLDVKFYITDDSIVCKKP